MPIAKFSSVDEYIAKQPEEVRVILQRVRGTLRKALPGATEVISYGIPANKIGDNVVVWFAGWKQHYSLYPVNSRLQTSLKADLGPYKVSKGTLRLPLSKPVPEKLIARIARLRAQEVGKGERKARRR